MKSMTGYGTAAAEGGGARVEVVIRSVNSRFGEIRYRGPAELASCEAEVRRRVGARIRRGRAEVAIALISEDPAPVRVRLNRGLAGEYLRSAERLRDEFGLEGHLNLKDLIGLPGLVEVDRPAEASAPGPVLNALWEALDAALEAHDAVRRQEGDRLAADLRTRFDAIERLRGEIAGLAAGVPAAARQRLLDRIGQLAAEIPLDSGRIEQEAALIADRADITEELVRLDSHLEAGRELLDGDPEPVGKRLEFLLQEIGRETNTIGSKSADLEITRRVLAIKAETEKLREQAQNLE